MVTQKQDGKVEGEQDANSKKDGASVNKDKTSAGKGKFLSEKEISDMMSKAGYDAVQKAKAEHKVEMDALRKQLEETELLLAGDDEDKKTAIQKKRDGLKKDQRITDLEKENEDLRGQLEEANKSKEQFTAAENAEEVLKKYKGVSKDQLLKRSDGSLDDMVAYAKDHGELINPEDADNEDNVPDTNETTSKGGGDDESWRKEWYPTMNK